MSNTIIFTVINNYAKGGVLQISTVLLPVQHAARRSVLWKRILETFIYARFLESVISEIHQLWGSSFFGKCLKFNLHFDSWKKNSEKFSCFLDKCIWIGCVELSLLRIKYLSRAVNALTNSVKALHMSKRDFFQHNCLHSDQ